MTDIVMPKLSDSMEQGTIITWFKSTGDQVELGDELLEIETDKSTAPYAAEVSGVLEIVVAVGTTVQVGELIARIATAANALAAPEAAAPTTAELAHYGAGGMTAARIAAPQTEVASFTASPSPYRDNGHGADVKATPLARRVAAAQGVALENVRGTGPLGRITRADVLGHAGLAIPSAEMWRQPRPPSPVQSTDQPVPASPGTRRQEPSRLQQLIARRMSEAKSTIPHFQVQTEVDMDAAIALRGELKAIADETQPVPSINDVIIKAAATALRSHPLANGSYHEGAFELHDAINVGIAVAAEEALVVPTLFHADTKSLGQIAGETRRLASSVRAGTITPQDLSGGTFTVSNLGMFGMTAITPVINPPQAAILGVGAFRPTLARVDGEIIERHMLTLTLSCDHRILYGADAAQFLAHIRDLLETPLRLAL
jgi:pyruvate dehydrogenase E2 component (dihydrolipoamide acetyltransferase)